MTLTETLVDVLLSAYRDPPSAVPAEAAGRLLFDHWGCRLAGDRVLSDGWERGLVERQAAAACVLDRDDVHWSSLTHPGSIIWPVVLDVGRRTDADGPSALRAAVLGYEVCVRVAETLGASHRGHWHSTATAGTIGAAMSAALLLDADVEHVVRALGHAISVAGGSSRSLVEGSGTKVFHRAHGARTGIACANAAAVMTATREGLESPQGMLAAMSSAPDWDLLARPVQRWAIAQTGMRAYATMGFAHTAAEAASLLGPRHPEAVDEVRVSVSSVARTLAGIAYPMSDEEAWWSVPHAVAASLVHGSPSVLEAGLQTDASLVALLDRVHFDEDRDDLGATVTVTAADHTWQTASVDLPVGHHERVLTEEQQLAKWATLTGVDGQRALRAAAGLSSMPVRDLLREAGRGTELTQQVTTGTSPTRPCGARHRGPAWWGRRSSRPTA